MSDETTPAIERAVTALDAYVGTHTQDMEADGVPEMAVREAEVRAVLDAALDVEEMARALYMRPSRDKDFPTWEDQSDHVRGYWREYARVIRVALLGGAS